MESIDLNKLYLNVAISAAQLANEYAETINKYADPVKEETIPSVVTTYEMWYAGVLGNSIGIDDIINISDILGTTNPTENEHLLHLTKAGSYLRYAADIGNMDFSDPFSEEFANTFYELIDKKNNEDSPTEEAMEEIEKLMEETDELMDEMELEDTLEEDESEE